MKPKFNYRRYTKNYFMVCDNAEQANIFYDYLKSTNETFDNNYSTTANSQKLIELHFDDFNWEPDALKTGDFVLINIFGIEKWGVIVDDKILYQDGGYDNIDSIPLSIRKIILRGAKSFDNARFIYDSCKKTGNDSRVVYFDDSDRFKHVNPGDLIEIIEPGKPRVKACFAFFQKNTVYYYPEDEYLTAQKHIDCVESCCVQIN